MMKGRNGQPIKILNLPLPFMNDHTQYKSIAMHHKSKRLPWLPVFRNSLAMIGPASST